MDFSKKVSSAPNICKVYLDFTGKSLAYNPSSATFHDTIVTNGLIKETYFHKSTIQFSEISIETAAGTKFEQRLSISFNNNDQDRSKRLLQLIGVKHIILKLDTGEVLCIGRNDYVQNKKPNLETTNTHIKTQADFSCESIIPASNYIGNILINLPGIIPLDFIL